MLLKPGQSTKINDAQQDLLKKLRELQENTLDVVECISLWRLGMWRPQPFVWSGQNYLIKIQTDTFSGLFSASAESKLSLGRFVSLKDHDRLCIDFSDKIISEDSEKCLPKQFSEAESVDLLGSISNALYNRLLAAEELVRHEKVPCMRSHLSSVLAQY